MSGFTIIVLVTQRISLASWMVSLIGTALFMIISYPQLKTQANQFLQVSKDKIVLVDNLSSVSMEYAEINKIVYHGTRLIVMTEHITLHSETKTINIDFNYKKYLKVWQEAATLCLLGNNQVVIDERIRKRTERVR